MKRSVRLKLLFMALLPLILLMPLLLLLGLSRWNAEYDRLLISNVESDLRIAEQYLSRIMISTSTDLSGIAGAVEFAQTLSQPKPAQLAYLERKRVELGMDFLYYLPTDPQVKIPKWPVIQTAMSGQRATSIDIFQSSDLNNIQPTLALQAQIDLIDTKAAVPTQRTIETRGMIVHSASPVSLNGQKGALVGGILLNRNLNFIDTINELVYRNAITGGVRQGTATLFLEDVRISTNVRLFEDVRALGTRVSAEVRHAVLDQGDTWLARAFVVNDWYVSGYLPIHDSFDQHVGMLYVGFLEKPFSDAKKGAILWMFAAFIAVLLISAPLFLWLAKGIFTPLEAMTKTMKRVEAGDLSARNGNLASGEIGQVAAHLDSLLEQVQDRDQKLRDWADLLNSRVDQRTSELREAHSKLEETTQQLVMSEKLAAIGEITAGVAHEINNPVAVIQGNVDVVREILGPASDKVETELSLIDHQIARITAIVGKLLQFARPSDYSNCHSLTTLNTAVADCLVLVNHELSNKSIDVRTDLDETPLIQIDTGELQQVIINLIMNALQAMGERGVLTLTLKPEHYNAQHGACLTVQDSGAGIHLTGTMVKVFDPFFTTKQGKGTGLGLSISQTIIQRAGGLISVRNPPNGGAEFRVWLPAA